MGEDTSALPDVTSFARIATRPSAAPSKLWSAAQEPDVLLIWTSLRALLSAISPPIVLQIRIGYAGPVQGR